MQESSNHRKVEYARRDSLQNVNSTAPTLRWTLAVPPIKRIAVTYVNKKLKKCVTKNSSAGTTNSRKKLKMRQRLNPTL
jgi:hypothetical protein